MQVDPIAELRRIDLRELLLWQARRSLEDFWGPKPGTAQPFNGTVKPYFAIVAADDLSGADKLQRTADVPEAARLEQLTAAAENVVRPSVNPERLLADDTIAEIPQSMTANVGAGLPRGEAAVFLEYSRGPLPAKLRDSHSPCGGCRSKCNPPGPLRLPEYRHRQGLGNRQPMAGKGPLSRARPHGGLQLCPPAPGVEIVFRPQPVTAGEDQRPRRIEATGRADFHLRLLRQHGRAGRQVQSGLAGENRRRPQRPVQRAGPLAGDSEACRTGMIVYGHRVWENETGEIVVRNPNNLNQLIPVTKLVPPNPALLNLRRTRTSKCWTWPGVIATDSTRSG